MSWVWVTSFCLMGYCLLCLLGRSFFFSPIARWIFTHPLPWFVVHPTPGTAEGLRARAFSMHSLVNSVVSIRLLSLVQFYKFISH
jgi:hypothetical protein